MDQYPVQESNHLIRGIWNLHCGCKNKIEFLGKIKFSWANSFFRIIKHVTKMNLLFNLNLGLPTDKPNMAMFMVSVNFYVIHYITKFFNFQPRVTNVQLNIIRRLVEIMIISYHIIFFFLVSFLQPDLEKKKYYMV